MAGQIILQKAGKNDASLLSSIHEECFPNYWDSEAFTNFFAIGGTYAYLIFPSPLMGQGQGGGGSRDTPHPNLPPQGGKEHAVGMIVYRLAGDQADIITLGVRKAARRQGIARHMMELVQSHLHGLGAKSLFLDVEEGNWPAIALYESLGFTHTSRRKLYYRQKDGSYTDALVMSKKIA